MNLLRRLIRRKPSADVLVNLRATDDHLVRVCDALLERVR